MQEPSLGRQGARFLAFALMLVAPVGFGLLGKPIEAGVCVVAAAIALVFSDIDRFESFGGAGFSAKLRTLEKQVEALTEKQTEPLPRPESEDEGDAKPLSVSEQHQQAEQVLKALDNPRYTWRYLEGIAKETKLAQFEVWRALAFLVSRGYARVSEGKHGRIWAITDKAQEARAADGSFFLSLG